MARDIKAAVEASKGGAVEFRVEKAGIVHAGVGKASFTQEALEENIRAFTDAVERTQLLKRSATPGEMLEFVKSSELIPPAASGEAIEAIVSTQLDAAKHLDKNSRKLAATSPDRASPFRNTGMTAHDVS